MNIQFRLTPIEELFFYDDRPGWPATFFGRLKLSGELDRELAELAHQSVIQRHPLAAANIRAVRPKQLWWNRVDTVDTFRWAAARTDESWAPMSGIDLRHDAPLRVWCFSNSQGSNIVFQVHHAAFDGLGAFQLLTDWLTVYHRLVNGKKTGGRALRQYDSELLNIRCRPSQSTREQIRLLPGQWKSARAAFQFFNRKAIPLASCESRDPDCAVQCTQPSVITRKLTPAETLQFREVARTNRSTANDLLARDLFVTIRRWFESNDASIQGSHVRIMIPVNERTLRHRRLPACNHCTMINLDRSLPQIEDSQELLGDIHQEMSVIKKWQLSLNFWRTLSFSRWLPGGLSRRTKTSECMATTVLTNLGDLLTRARLPQSDGKLVSGNVCVEDFELVVPLRPGTAAGFAVFYYQDRLCISMHYQNDVMSVQQAEAFADLFLQQLRETCREGNVSSYDRQALRKSAA